MIKNPYQKDYQNELKQNRHGLLVTRTSYQGDFYVLPFDEQQKRRTGILNVIWTIALWVIELGMGLLNPDSSRTAWIVFPYLFVILPLGYMLYGAVSYIGAPLRMHRAHYETGLLRMKRSCNRSGSGSCIHGAAPWRDTDGNGMYLSDMSFPVSGGCIFLRKVL